jgi:hypothetical protein
MRLAILVLTVLIAITGPAFGGQIATPQLGCHE